MSNLSTAVIFRSYRALMAVYILVCRVVAVVPTYYIKLGSLLAVILIGFSYFYLKRIERLCRLA